MRGKKIILICALFMLIATLIFINSYENDFIPVNSESTASFSTPWQYDLPGTGEKGEVSLPAQLNAEDGNIILTNQLPEELMPGASILLFTKQQSIHVYLDDELIYSYPSTNQEIFQRAVPDAWHILQLPDTAAGATIRVELLSHFPLFTGHLKSIDLGSKSAHIFHLFSLYFWDMFFAQLIILAGILIMGSHILNKAIQIKYANIIYLGIFALSMGIFLLLNSPLILLILPNPYLLSFLSMSMLYFIPVPMLIFLNKTYQPRKKILLSICTAVAAVVFILSSLLQLLGLVDWITLLPFYVFSLFIYFSAVAYISAWEAKDGNPHMRQFFLFFSIFMVGLLLDLGRLGLDIYSTKSFSFTEWPVLLFTKLGFFLSLTVLLFKTSTFLSDSYNQIKRSETLTLLAYTDLLTGVQNQKSFAAEIERRKKAGKKQAFTIFMLDIDQLDTANADHGKEFGNAVLKSTGELILTVFGKDDLAYRLGGDEFFILSPEINDKIIQKKMQRFREKLMNHNLSGEFSVSIALVHHICRPKAEDDIKEALQTIEQKMVAYKEEIQLAKETKK